MNNLNRQCEKKVFTKVPSALHAQVKAQASIEGLFLEKWVQQAIEEKLARTSRRK